MFTDIFIHFLLIKNLIDEKQAREVLSKRGTKVRPSVVAVYEGLMTEQQAKNIIALQTEHDMPFGFLAVREGFLTHEQVANISGRHTKDDMRVMQVLTDKGIMNMNTVMEHLAVFKEYFNLTDDAYEALADNKIESYVEYIGGVEVDKLFAKYVTVFIKTFIRCIDSSLRIEEAYTAESIESAYISKIQCFGDRQVTVGIAIDDLQSALNLASRFVRQRQREFNEDVEDSIKEFLNIAAGLFAALVEKDLDINIDLQAPEMIVDDVFCSTEQIEVINVYSFDCTLKVFITEQ